MLSTALATHTMHALLFGFDSQQQQQQKQKQRANATSDFNLEVQKNGLKCTYI